MFGFDLNIKRKIFISYHHGNDQASADFIKRIGNDNDIFTDCSLERSINSTDTDYVQWAIKQNNLKGSSVTIVLCGADTYKRKYVDWEIYHTLELGHGLLALKLPNISINYSTGGLIVPNRLYDNYISKYAVWSSDWDLSCLKFLIEQAFNNSQSCSRLINNTREKMIRNQS